MKLIGNGFFYFAVLLVLLSVFTAETEARRKILKGRKTITTRYYRPLAIPAWAIIVLCAIGYLIIGGVLYLAMNKFVLSKSYVSSNSYTPASMNDV